MFKFQNYVKDPKAKCNDIFHQIYVYTHTHMNEANVHINVLTDLVAEKKTMQEVIISIEQNIINIA